MAGSSIDLIAPGPAPADPYEPAASAWALARGLSARGHAVRVVHPAAASEAPAPDGIEVVTFPSVSRHVGYVRGDAELALAARRHLRPGVDVVIRDPLRPGALGVGGGHRAPAVIALVRGVELEAFDQPGAPVPGRGLRARLDRWRDRSTLRKLELAAVSEARRVFCETSELAARLREEYGVAPERLGELRRAVGYPATMPTRAAARGAVGIPLDDPLVVAVAPSSDPADPGLARVREAFARLRPIFAGARLVLAGAAAPAGNGITVRPARDTDSLATAVAAADLAVFLGGTPSFDPGVALALRAGVAVLTSPRVRLPPGTEAAVRRLSSDDTGELSSAFAELLADPAARRELARGAAEQASLFAPEQVAADLEASGALAPLAR